MALISAKPYGQTKRGLEVHFKKQHGHAMLESLGIEMSKSRSMKDTSKELLCPASFLSRDTYIMLSCKSRTAVCEHNNPAQSQ